MIGRRYVWGFAGAAALFFGCAQDAGLGPDGGGIPGPDGAATSCVPCVTDSDCNGGVCAQLGGDSFCASTCTTTADCASGQTCELVSSVTGDPSNVCVVANDPVCGLNQPPPPPTDAGTTTNTCPGLASPTTSAGCTSCKQGSSNCQANGCFGGWWCNTQTNKCQQPPTTCTSPSGDAGPPPTFDGGVNGNISANGGTESHLFFAIVGDTRPATEDDTANYPTAIIGTIFKDLAGLPTVPPFVVSTGDYQFSNPYGNQAAAQLQLYLNARGSYPGVQFPTMGNHECTGATASNCGPNGTNGITNNYSSFMSMMLGPLQKSTPYYVVNVNSNTNAWTAKFVFVAANAWDSTQATWLDQTLSKSTTYTFIVRHEPANATTAPGVTPSETIMAKHPYTLSIVGHSHEYKHYSGSREVLIGNGGAPLGTSQDYGYGIVAERTDGSLTVDMYDYQTNQADPSFHFAVNPNGSPAP